jgi:hypothetical protein
MTTTDRQPETGETPEEWTVILSERGWDDFKKITNPDLSVRIPEGRMMRRRLVAILGLKPHGSIQDNGLFAWNQDRQPVITPVTKEADGKTVPNGVIIKITKNSTSQKAS